MPRSSLRNARHLRFAKERQKLKNFEETTMRKTVLTLFGAALIAASTVQIASAAENHQARKVQHFRNANAAVVVVPDSPYVYSGGWSAPAGH
jgi:hypothetical protein